MLLRPSEIHIYCEGAAINVVELMAPIKVLCCQKPSPQHSEVAESRMRYLLIFVILVRL